MLQTIFSVMSFVNAKLIQSALKAMQNQDPDASFEEKIKGAGKFIGALVISDVFINILKTQNSFMVTMLTQRI